MIPLRLDLFNGFGFGVGVGCKTFVVLDDCSIELVGLVRGVLASDVFGVGVVGLMEVVLKDVVANEDDGGTPSVVALLIGFGMEDEDEGGFPVVSFLSTIHLP